MTLSMFEKACLAVLAAAWLAWGTNWIGNALVSAEPLQTTAIKVDGNAGEAAKETKAAPEKPNEPAASGALAMLAAADAGAGAKVFKKCNRGKMNPLE